MTNQKLTTIVRKDLGSGYKTAQTAHAVANFAVEHSEEFKAWQHGSNYICCLEATSNVIDKVTLTLLQEGIKVTVFREPDMNNEITSIAVEALPEQLHKEFFKKFKLSK